MSKVPAPGDNTIEAQTTLKDYATKTGQDLGDAAHDLGAHMIRTAISHGYELQAMVEAAINPWGQDERVELAAPKTRALREPVNFAEGVRKSQARQQEGKGRP